MFKRLSYVFRRLQLRALGRELGDAWAFVLHRNVLVPAADFLPRGGAMLVARGLAWLITIGTMRGLRARRSRRRSFGGSNTDALRAARAWIETPLRDFVYERRVFRGREAMPGPKFVETGSEHARRLRAEGGPLIFATGHFVRQAMHALYTPQATPGLLGFVVAPMPQPSWRPSVMRTRLVFGQILECIRKTRAGVLCEVVAGGGKHATRSLIRHLKDDRQIVIVHVDAPWKAERSWYKRPFAGHAQRVFSVGIARLARITQTPIVVCIPYQTVEGHTVLEWHDPILPPPPTETEADERVTDQMLDAIESAVGRRPEQYVLDVFGTRHWNASAERWQVVDL
ncbi:MAG: hypothetical protein M3436_02100 [Pseudomonadota bacterium]|nr:hypothetical protein [Pseudomonadota bacterium]